MPFVGVNFLVCMACCVASGVCNGDDRGVRGMRAAKGSLGLLPKSAEMVFLRPPLENTTKDMRSLSIMYV
jgi:hypothetical protein